MRIVVVGAGAWGTALAISAASNPLAQHDVSVWARDAEQAAAMHHNRCNARYLSSVSFPPALQVVNWSNSVLLSELARSDLVVLATPMKALREWLVHLHTLFVPVVWLSKGFEAAQDAGGCLGHEIQLQVAPHLRCGVLSGPSFALEVAQARPAALVAASTDPEVRQVLVSAFHSPHLRIYANDDVVGVEVGGAVKNVLAIATGLCDGLQLGTNARAALITRGLAEMTRLGVALGARADTFMGLSGLGDLVLTATGDLSRNRRVGLSLAAGHSLADAVAALGHVAEGVYSARTVLQRAEQAGVDMPITRCVVGLLDGLLQPAEAVARLMEREPVAESTVSQI